VSILNAPGIVIGVWNWTTSTWSQGGDWIIPVATNVTMVLDTGLQSATLTGDYFWTFMISSNYGAVGTSLQ
jgi:hypothetical protein